MRGIEGKVTLITGAAKGIGFSIAERLSEEGAHTILVDVADGVKSAFERIRETNVKNLGYARLMDVTNREECYKVVDEIVKKLGKIDFLVNNAALLVQARFMDYTDEMFDQVMDVNVKGVFICCQAALRYMIKQNYGCIINIGSSSGKSGEPGANLYSATKGAVIRLTQAMSVEMAENGIRVNCVCPGPTDSDQYEKAVNERSRILGLNADEMRKKFDSGVPIKGKRPPKNVANVVAFMLSDEAAFITGEAINVSGGMVWW